MIPWLLMCGPLVLALYAWGQLLRKREWPNTITLVALSAATLNAIFGAGLIIYYKTHPTSDTLPPWQDPAVLNSALLMLSAPISVILGLVALAKSGNKWIVLIVELISIPLLLVGCASAASV